MLKDLHTSHPTPSKMVIVPTHRDPVTGLALSSRNAYLSPQEYEYAPSLRQALKLVEEAFLARAEKSQPVTASCLRKLALDYLQSQTAKAQEKGVTLKADYIAFNEPETLTDLEEIRPGVGAVLSGAMWCGKTRLIDNIVLDYNLNAP
jgi:pantoate--beta-alanine ligase